MRLPKYTEQQLIEAVQTSTSYSGVLSKLGLVQAGGTQRNIIDKVSRLGLDTSHFTGQGWSKGKAFPEKYEETLQRHISGKTKPKPHYLRLLLIKTGRKEAKCETCGIIEWNSLPAPLELHHIDGNKYNNALENLTILCPNCHAQTDNHAGRGKRKKLKDKAD